MKREHKPPCNHKSKTTTTRILSIALTLAILTGSINLTALPAQAAGKKPGKTAIMSVKSDNNGKVTVTIKKAKRAAGYQVVLATDKKFKKNKIIVKTTKLKTKTKKTKPGTTYYVRARACGKTGKKYGKWSKIKTVTTPKKKTTSNQTAISSISYNTANGKTTIKVKKVDNVTGYQIYLAKDKKFVKDRISLKSKKTTITTQKTEANETYYVKARTYKIKNFDIIYGKWSAIKTFTTSKSADKEYKKFKSYSYEVIPLLEPFNDYFFIKTDNPDPESFRIIDKDSKYLKDGYDGTITLSDNLYADVKYTNKKTRRVKNGYIAVGNGVDGGSLTIQYGKYKGLIDCYNGNTGKWEKEKYYEYKDTDIKLKTGKLMDEVDYLISTYGSGKKGLFAKLDAIQIGLSSECLYEGAYVLGKQKKSTQSPYYGLSTSPHMDQSLYIQDPYYREDSQYLLTSVLYPFCYDSYFFPSAMIRVTERLNKKAKVEWSSSYHYLIDVTYGGKTRSYGGAGTGGGQGIRSDQIKYWFKFDGSKNDAYLKRDKKTLKTRICAYGKLNVPDDPKDEEPLTWAKVRKTAGTGSYVKLLVADSIFFGVTGEGFAYLYDDKSDGDDNIGYASVGFLSNTWYDGRFFNAHEYFVPGVKFTEEHVKEDLPSITVKDLKAPLPDLGEKTYTSAFFDYDFIDNSEYDRQTGIWKRYTEFSYNEEKNAWVADILERSSLYDRKTRTYEEITDPDFVDACTITMAEAKAMNLDANTNKNPTSYYNYNMQEKPGTWHTS